MTAQVPAIGTADRSGRMSEPLIEPTAVYPAGRPPRRPGRPGGPGGDSAGHQGPGGGQDGGFPQPRPGGLPVGTGPLVATIGAIPGLRPRRTRRRRGADTPGPDVDLIDAAGRHRTAGLGVTGLIPRARDDQIVQARNAALIGFGAA
ncbi:hypothetical protein ACGFIV_35605 [Sphaerisporangium sp. NPDC049003]|uniref:hypothetical protein n=1 Tax=Sphaerisporangium sp. NPDC049003 TaxID=3364517 RepID=UPI003718DFD6